MPDDDNGKRECSDGIIPLAYLIDTISCATSGTEKQLLETIRRLDRDKFEPFLICLHESPWLKHNDLPCSCTILGYRGLLKPNIFRVVRLLREILSERNIKILQTFFEDSIFIAWLASFGLKNTIVLLSSRRDMGLGAGNQPWYHRLFEILLPLVNRRFDGIIANSYQVREYVAKREKTPKEKIEVIYNGVERSTNNEKIPAIFHDQAADCWIVIVASLSPVKRHDLFVEAMAMLRQRINDCKVRALVLGKGPLEKTIVKQATAFNVDNMFIFQGAVQNVNDYLHQCDIGVLCSDREGLSNAILEYMACGLPVVATAVGGNPELIDESIGICIPPDSAQALSDALFRLVIDIELRKRMGWASRKKASLNFSWSNSIRQLESYYEKKLQEKG